MAIGEIIGTIATHTFDSTWGSTASLTQILDNLHCIAYSGPAEDGWSKSILITAAGAISEPASNTLEWLDANAQHMRSVLRPSDVHVICYHDEPDAAFIEAVIVNADGTLSQHANHGAQFAAEDCFYYRPIHIAGNTVAIAYGRFTGQAFIITWSVTDEGAVAASQIQDFEFTPSFGNFCDIQRVTDNVFVVSFQTTANVGHARSVNITDLGAISYTAYGAVSICAQMYSFPNMVKLKDNVFVAVCRGPDLDGWAAVFQCSDAGEVTVPTNNLFEFDIARCENPRLIRISDDIFAVIYALNGSQGYIKTIRCTLASAATWEIVSTFEYAAGAVEYPMIIHRDGNVYAIVYADANSHGIIKTIEITASPLVHAHTELIMGMGP